MCFDIFLQDEARGRMILKLSIRLTNNEVLQKKIKHRKLMIEIVT